MSKELEFKFIEINCPVCNSESRRFIGWRGGEAHQNGAGVKTAIVRCRDCTHLYPNPMPFPVETLDKVYVDAEEYFHDHALEEKKANALKLVGEFETRIGNRGRILDVGCGTGELIWAAKESGWDFEGVDPSSEFISVGKERLGVEGRVGTLEQARFDDGSFDAVVLSGIIEHLYDPFATFSEVHRVLKPGGWIFFDVPNEDGLYMLAGNLYMKLMGRDWVVVMAPTFPPYHVQGFNPRSLKRLMDRSRFLIREVEMAGGVCEQQGEKTLKKLIEHRAARLINSVGRVVNRGSYMGVWAQRA